MHGALLHEWKAENLGNLLNRMLYVTYVVVVVVQLRGVEVFTFTQGKGVTLLFRCSW